MSEIMLGDTCVLSMEAYNAFKKIQAIYLKLHYYFEISVLNVIISILCNFIVNYSTTWQR